MSARTASPTVDLRCANAARIYDFMLGGKDNFEVDRREAQRFLRIAPELQRTCAANRRFMERAVRLLAGRGVTQFIELGVGLPAGPNVHEIAQRVNPAARVVYVDNDPLVASHGRALLTTGTSTMIEADLSDPATVLEHGELHRLLDMRQPVAILMMFLLPYLANEQNPAGIVAHFMEGAAPGSHLVLTHPTDEINYCKYARLRGDGSADWALGSWRGYADILSYFSGLYVLKPGLVPLSLWRPDDTDSPQLGSVWAYGGVGRK